jgi:hypothetical protein
MDSSARKCGSGPNYESLGVKLFPWAGGTKAPASAVLLQIDHLVRPNANKHIYASGYVDFRLEVWYAPA